MSNSELKLQPGAHIEKEKSESKSFVLSSKNIESTAKKYIGILSLLSIMLVLHAHIVSAINPRRFHRAATTNILILTILFSAMI